MEISIDWPDAIKEYNRRVTELFGISSPSWRQSGNSLTVRFSKSNHSFKDSKYFLHPAGQSFSHLTTYKGLFGILNSGLIRLYSLDNSNDPNELFSIKGIPTFEHVADNIKPYVYTFSFCKSESILNPLIWQGYGQVALNFQIVNDPLGWEYFRISPMHYGESELIPNYSKLLEEMHQKFSPWHFEPDIESMLSLFAFHKEVPHSYEREIRLLYVPFLLNDRDKANFDFHLSNVRTGMTKYIELPLYVGNEDKAWIYGVKRHGERKDDCIPLIRITSIEFGDNEPRFSQNELDKIRYDLEDYLVGKFGYRIEVKKTLFTTGVDSH
jgi:hypothetical protein